jgi:hypothetical protein
MKPQWFESWGWIYRPIAWQASLSLFLPCWILAYWVASKTARPES